MTIKVAQPLKELLKSPKLSIYANQLQTYLDDEQQRRDEFYDWITEDIKAEFINGEVIVQTPARKRHTDASMNLSALLAAYVDLHELGFVGAETVLTTLTRNDYLPDICFFDVKKAQGFSPEQVNYPPPDFVIEILSPSTASTDRGTKYEDYAIHGVQEYWLVDPAQQTIEQYALRAESYDLLLKIKHGDISSEVVTGFTIPVAAIFDGKVKNRVLVQMLATE